jgi:hypothetical protein
MSELLVAIGLFSFFALFIGRFSSLSYENTAYAFQRMKALDQFLDSVLTKEMVQTIPYFKTVRIPLKKGSQHLTVLRWQAHGKQEELIGCIVKRGHA